MGTYAATSDVRVAVGLQHKSSHPSSPSYILASRHGRTSRYKIKIGPSVGGGSKMDQTSLADCKRTYPQRGDLLLLRVVAPQLNRRCWNNLISAKGFPHDLFPLCRHIAGAPGLRCPFMSYVPSLFEASTWCYGTFALSTG